MCILCNLVTNLMYDTPQIWYFGTLDYSGKETGFKANCYYSRMNNFDSPVRDVRGSFQKHSEFTITISYT